MRWTLGVGVLLSLAMLLPTGHAEPVTGLLSIQDASFPSGTETTLEPDAALVEETERVDALTLTAARLRVTFYEKQFLTAPVPLAPAVTTNLVLRSFTVTAASVAKALDGNHSGFLGFYPQASATLRLTGAQATSAQPSAASAIESGGPFTSDAPSLWWYSQHVEGPHVRLSTQGALSYVGPGMFKVYGLDVTIQGAENDTSETFRTGLFQDDALHGRQTWLILEADTASLNVDGSAPVIAATKAPASLAWNGAATVRGATGTIRSEGATYTANGGRETLDGTLMATLEARDGNSANLRAEGDLQRTTLLAAAVTRSPVIVPAPLAWGLGALALSIAVLVIILGIWFSTRRLIDRDYCLEMADAAQRVNDYASALVWQRRARYFMRGSVRLLADEARVLALLGKHEAALRCFEKAHARSQSGEAALMAASVMHKLGHPSETVLAWIARGLERSPSLADQFTQHDFAALRSDPRWANMLRHARESTGLAVRP